MASTMEHDILKDMNNPDEIETLHVYPVDGGILILREDDIIDSDPPNNLPDSRWLEKNMFPIFILVLCLFLCLDSLIFYLPSLLAPIATITIVPDQQNITLKTTLNLEGRMLPTLTISQSKTVQATGRGHQNASSATGTITFYNGLLTSQTIPAGTQLTGSDGITIVTTQDVFIPAANPPTEGQATVSAHALQNGLQGNISAKDINKPCCLTSVLAVNFTAFQGGQNARDFTYVTKQDIQNISSPIEKTISQSVLGALASQITSGESLVPLSCKPITSSDHQVGEETSTITVTVSESCSAMAYMTSSVQDKAVQAIQVYAERILGKEYVLFGSVRTNVLSTTRTKITISIQGVWVYRVNEQHIKQLVQGKNEKDASRILSSLKGIRKVTVTGNIPTDENHIHVILLSF